MPSKKHVLVILAVLCLFGSIMLPHYALAGGVAGQPWVFGQNYWGHLGIGPEETYGDQLYPVMPIGVAGAVKGIVGLSTTAILISDGTVRVAGVVDNFGQPGYLLHLPYFCKVPSLDNVVDLTLGYVNTALKSDGTVWVWRASWYAGDTGLTSRIAKIEGLSNIIAISFGGAADRDERRYLWAVRSDGSVWRVDLFQSDAPSQPVQVEGLRDIVAISAGAHHCLALDSNGKVWSWGSNYYGQLGNGNRKFRVRPARVRGLKDITAIAAGESNSVALKANGHVWVWGGVYMNGQWVNTLPTRVNSLSRVKAIGAGFDGIHAVKEDGSLWSFGYNRYGQLGNGTTENSVKPSKAVGLEDVVSVFGGNCSTLAITAPPQAAAKQ